VSIEQLITEHLDIWTAADTEKKSGRGRSSGSAGSVYGIKKLRELILELAVRGKLVPQDSSDEPASELLKRIATEKAKFAVGGRKNGESTLLLSEDNKPYSLPKNWTWVKLGQVVEVLDSQRKPVTKQDREPGPYPYYGASGIVDYVSDYIFDEPLVIVGEDGAKWGRGENTAFLIVGKTWVNNHAHVIRPYKIALIDKFLSYSLNAMNLMPFITGMTVPKLNQAKLVSIELPLPPIAEQHRIVAKVDELMALCDQLENQHNNAAEAHEKLVTHLLGTLTQSQNAEDFNTNWQRISEHFDTLFTTEASIDALKQTLLQLAVMGKLVPQDPNDEPASELLKRIQAEKAQLIAEGKIKKDKPLAEITDDEKPFELPVGWEWVQWYDILANDDAAFKRGPFGSSLTKSMFVKSGYKVYEQYCPINDDCSFERYYITPDKFEEMKGFAVKSGDYLVSCSGVTLGRITQIPKDFKEGIINQAILRVRINHRYYDKDFFKLLFRSQFFQKQIFDNSTGSAIPNVKGVKDLKVMPIPLFTVEEQSRIVTKVDELMTICDQLKERITLSNQLQQKLADVVIEQAISQ